MGLRLGVFSGRLPQLQGGGVGVHAAGAQQEADCSGPHRKDTHNQWSAGAAGGFKGPKHTEPSVNVAGGISGGPYGTLWVYFGCVH